MADINRPKLLVEGSLSTEGKQLIEWLDVNTAEALAPGASPMLMNALHGPLKEYASLVYGATRLPVEKWLETFQQSATNAWELMKYVEGQAKEKADAAAKLNETVDKTAAIEAQLAEIKEALSLKVTELETANARLIAENNALKTAKPADKPVAKVGKGKKEAEPVVEATEEKEVETENEPSTEE